MVPKPSSNTKCYLCSLLFSCTLLGSSQVRPIVVQSSWIFFNQSLPNKLGPCPAMTNKVKSWICALYCTFTSNCSTTSISWPVLVLKAWWQGCKTALGRSLCRVSTEMMETVVPVSSSSAEGVYSPARSAQWDPRSETCGPVLPRPEVNQRHWIHLRSHVLESSFLPPWSWWFVSRSPSTLSLSLELFLGSTNWC